MTLFSASNILEFEQRHPNVGARDLPMEVLEVLGFVGSSPPREQEHKGEKLDEYCFLHLTCLDFEKESPLMSLLDPEPYRYVDPSSPLQREKAYCPSGFEVLAESCLEDRDGDDDEGLERGFGDEQVGADRPTMHTVGEPSICPAGGHNMTSLLETYKRTMNTYSVVAHIGHRKNCVVFTMPNLHLEKGAFVSEWDGRAAPNQVCHVAVDNTVHPPSSRCTCAMFIGLGSVTPGGTERMQCVHCKVAVDDLLPIAIDCARGHGTPYANLAR